MRIAWMVGFEVLLSGYRMHDVYAALHWKLLMHLVQMLNSKKV